MSDSRKPFLDMLADLGLDAPYNPTLLEELAPDIQGWGHEDPIFDYVIRHWHPRTIVEVGSWKGASAIKMAEVQRSYGIDGLILCIDTWLGSNESLWRDADVRRSLMLKDGYPSMFRQFQANILASDNAGRIRHLPMTSTSAAELIGLYGCVADACYIDAGHLEAEVYGDIRAYWPLVKPGGILFGDDYSDSWPGTIKAVNRFAAEVGLKLRATDWKWMFVKPS